MSDSDEIRTEFIWADAPSYPIRLTPGQSYEVSHTMVTRDRATGVTTIQHYVRRAL